MTTKTSEPYPGELPMGVTPASDDTLARILCDLSETGRRLFQASESALALLREPEAECHSNAQPREKEKNMPITIPTEINELMTRAEVAELLRIDPRTLDRLRADPEARFPRPIQLGRLVRWRRSTIERWLTARAS